ncbi:MAG: maltose alpha-D-glucosyltransferase [Chloroflexota bacterium]|nr:maltose alpha-D-glucosyltransferase [Chloroflexota bacterium]
MSEYSLQPLWYKDAIIYQISVRAFFDSNNDGNGDIPGLTSKLDYIESLGVDCVWLMPFYVSPLRDGGYDIADYRALHPDFGTIEDFRVFVNEAHKRGIKVVTELVVNHTSDQHQWFRSARSSRDSEYRDYYVWSDTDQKYLDARIIFTDTERSNWTWDHEAGQYFWHRFFSHQPDLNYDNLKVQDEVLDVCRFWMELGVDGLRLDAIPYLFEREGTNCENLPETHEFLKKLRRFVDDHWPNRMLLAEANQWPEDVREYFGDGDECHMAYHFPVMPRMYMALRREERHPMTEILRQTPDIPDNCQWCLFLRNHDELTLEMVTDEERDYLYYEYAKDPRMRINVGIRRRLAPLLDNSFRRIQLMHLLLFSLPGTPVLYYGDEIGMGDNIYMGDRDGVRTPMQWNGDRNAGFSRADPQKLYMPPIRDPVYGYEGVNVEAQERTSTSLLQWMKRVIRIRKRYPVFGRGTIRFLHPSNRHVLAFVREHEDTKILIACNFSRFSQAAELDLREFEGYYPVELFGRTPFPRIGEWPYLLTFGPHIFYWFELKPEGSVE